MWLFTKHGFYSMSVYPQNDNLIQIRARAREDLENLDAFSRRVLGFGLPEIMETPTADYRYRVIVPRKTACSLAAEIVGEMDYDNFKGSVRKKERHSVYLRVWEIMRSLQARRG